MKTLTEQNLISKLEQAITEAIAQARETCQINGSNSSACAVAWDIVEELQAEKSHRRQAIKTKTYLETYCQDNPEADECRIYDV
ncbi:MAG: Calvin cycle protein CP12 [Fischerella sp.]|nr:Calvin cycle protein CP12 [Fischerella sp.]